MISVKEAKAIILGTVPCLPPVTQPLMAVRGLVLAADVLAAVDIPNFRQSSMDGYALSYSNNYESFKIIGEMAAGTDKQLIVLPGQATRIFTGAPLPLGADTVVMQEKVVLEHGSLLIKDPNLEAGQNVREQGAEIKGGMLAMKEGMVLTPAALGFLAGIGIAEASVIPRPLVSIIITGNELQQPGKDLGFGQVYEANGTMLTAVLKQAGVEDVVIYKAADDLDILCEVLDEALQRSDLVLLTGGVSVGDYDFVVEATRHCQIKQHFHKVKQKPGKPLYFGTKYNKVVFGLPGNPSSVLSCFYNYVLLAVGKLMNKELALKTMTASLSEGYKKASGLTHFLKGKYNGALATPLIGQESFKLHSFSQAGCLIELEELKADYAAGDQVSIHIIPEN
jgi:molybdopterin molybdotransferase